MPNVHSLNFDKSGAGILELDKYPDVCPFCHLGMEPRPMGNLFLVTSGFFGQMVFLCTRRGCERIFIAYYERSVTPSIKFWLKGLSAGNRRPLTAFSASIKAASSSFVEIFGQAEFAE